MAYINKISGIYLITCNNKHYVGRSSNCLERFSKHKSHLRKGIHHNSYLQNSWDKYGEDNFTFDVLDTYPIDTLPSMENWWCNMLNSHNRIYGFNIDPTSPYGKIKSSKETIDKIRISNTGKICSEETKHKLRIINTGKKCLYETKIKLQNTILCNSVDMYDNKGNFIENYKSIREASRKSGVIVKSIRLCIKGDFNIVKGYIFKYSGDLLTDVEIKFRNDNSHESKKVKVVGFYISGELIGEFDSYYQASKDTNLDSYKISLCCRGKQKRVKNTYWIHKEDEA